MLAAAEREDDRLRAWPLHHLEIAVEIVAETRLRPCRRGQQVDQSVDAIGPLQLRLLLTQPAQGRLGRLDAAPDKQLVDGHDPIHGDRGRKVGRFAPGVRLHQPSR